MKRLVFFALACCAAAVGGADVPAAADPMCKVADQALSQAAAIRTLPKRQDVPCEVHERAQIKNHLLDTIRADLPPQKLQNEGLLYRALGMVPDDFNYAERVVDIYISQIGGYYDPKKKRFVMADWSPAMMQNTVAVHELTHALQDQNFDLGKFVDAKNLNGDEMMARSALIEGDATAVMLDYNFKLLGQASLREQPDVESVMFQNIVGASLTSSLQDSPASLVALMIFPYTSGLRFVHHTLKRHGYRGIDPLYLRPPRSTEEILHPEKYEAAAPDFRIIDNQEVLPRREGEPPYEYEDVLGEFGVSAILYQAGVPENAEAAAGWGGDKAVVVPGADGWKRIVWKIAWDSARDAEEFFAAFGAGLKRRYPASTVTSSLSPVTPGKRMALSKNGQDVVVEVELRQ